MPSSAPNEMHGHDRNDNVKQMYGNNSDWPSHTFAFVRQLDEEIARMRQTETEIAANIAKCHESMDRIYKTPSQFSSSFPYQPCQQQTVEPPCQQLPGYIPRDQQLSDTPSTGSSLEGLVSDRNSDTDVKSSIWTGCKQLLTPIWEPKRDKRARSPIPDGLPALPRYQSDAYTGMKNGKESPTDGHPDGTGSARRFTLLRILRTLAKVSVPGLHSADEAKEPAPSPHPEEGGEQERPGTWLFVPGGEPFMPSMPDECKGTLCDTWVYCGCPHRYSCKHTRHCCSLPTPPVLPPVPRVAAPRPTVPAKPAPAEKKEKWLSRQIEWGGKNKQ